ncbi:MAG: AmmeMemoRadiSam system protein B [Candidatus Omnitrophica bacterium]|nr:AmmeMemoRadiSam system protein B [Candidatus Omnitrophota bacterium]
MEKYKVRPPVVAGQFYSSSPEALKNQIKDFIPAGETEKINAIACMLPHAGYMYSGAVAAQTVNCVNIKNKIILLGPNHTGNGAPFSIMTDGAWQTPLGQVKIDQPLAEKILKSSKYLEDDEEAQADEHSLEVELPILQYFRADFEIVPIALLSNDVNALKEIGKGIARIILETNLQDSTLIVASSDMTHYEPQEQAQTKDAEAIKAILELNGDKLMETIRRLDISMCGYAPAIAMLSAARLLGAKNAKLIKYQTSGEITQDMRSVVGYAGIIVYGRNK